MSLEERFRGFSLYFEEVTTPADSGEREIIETSDDCCSTLFGKCKNDDDDDDEEDL